MPVPHGRRRTQVCKNPRSPGFSHYLFESVAALIRHATAADPGMLRALEAQLFPPFQLVLQQDVQEFHPYVFQVRARGRWAARS